MRPEMSVSIAECDQTRVATSTWLKRVGAVMLIGMIMALGLIAPQLAQAESHTGQPGCPTGGEYRC